VGSNHHRTPYEGEDFQMFEKDLQATTLPLCAEQKWVICQGNVRDVNNSWGFNLKMRATKPEGIDSVL